MRLSSLHMYACDCLFGFMHCTDPRVHWIALRSVQDGCAQHVCVVGSMWGRVVMHTQRDTVDVTHKYALYPCVTECVHMCAVTMVNNGAPHSLLYPIEDANMDTFFVHTHTHTLFHSKTV